jgi:hypothetical protein
LVPKLSGSPVQHSKIRTLTPTIKLKTYANL